MKKVKRCFRIFLQLEGLMQEISLPRVKEAARLGWLPSIRVFLFITRNNQRGKLSHFSRINFRAVLQSLLPAQPEERGQMSRLRLLQTIVF